MKKFVSVLLAVLLLCAALPGYVSARGSDSFNADNYDDLKDYIDDIEDGYDITINIKDDIYFDDEIDIDASNVNIYFNGPAKFILDGECGFDVNGNNVSLYFKDITFKGIGRIHSEGQAFSIDGDYCLISGARFENCSTYDADTIFTGIFYNGGAIDVEDGTHCTIENCYFKECAAQGHAGAIYIDADDCTVINCTFDNCFATSAGGAIYICREQNNADIIDCTFINCGAIYKIPGKNVFANGNNGTVKGPTPYAEGDEYFRGCVVYGKLDIEEGDYTISYAPNLGRCLNIAGGDSATGNGAKLQLGTYSKVSGKTFTIIKDEATGAYIIKAKHSGLVLSVKDNVSTNGAQIIQWEDYGNLGQRWVFEDAGNGYVTIRSRLGKYMNVYGMGIMDGADIISYDYNGSNTSRFKLEIQKGMSIMWFAGSTLSQGDIWIIIGVALVCAAAIAVLVIKNKKKSK